MPQRLTTEGIIINTLPYGEGDLIFHALTREFGKLAFFARKARQSRRRFGGSLEVFDFGRFVFEQRPAGLFHAESFHPLKSFPGLRKDLGKITAASLICEAFDVLIHEESEREERPYPLLLETLEAIDRSSGARESMRLCFLALGELLDLTGYGSRANLPAPSARHLMELLDTVEHASERKLKTRGCLEDIIKQLSAKD